MVNDVPALAVLPGMPEWPKFEWVPMAHLFIDERYQRPPSRQVKKIVDDFNPRMVGAVLGSRRSKTKVAVIDGQHRFLAMRQRGDEYAPCLVSEKLTMPEEARLFAALQRERLNIRPVQRFRAELAGEVPRAVEISEVLESYSVSLVENSGRSAAPRSLSAVKAMEDVWEAGGQEYVARVLEVVLAAWDGEGGSLNNEILRGVEYFIAHENPDDTRLIDRLSKVPPLELMHRASALRTGRGMGGKSPGYMAEAIANIYRRRSK